MDQWEIEFEKFILETLPDATESEKEELKRAFKQGWDAGDR